MVNSNYLKMREEFTTWTNNLVLNIDQGRSLN